VGKRAPGWTKALSVRHEYATSGPGRRRAAAPARAAAARALRVTGYREADALANLAVRGLQLAAGELKAVDVSAAPGGVTSTGAAYLLNGIARGDDITERNGRQVTMKTIEVNAVFQPTTPALDSVPTCVRMMIIYDRQANAAALTPAQVLGTVGDGNAVIRPKNLENRERFLILRDMKFGLSSGEAEDFRAAPKIVKFYQGVNLPVTFNAGDAGTIADIITGSLYLLVISDDPAGAPEQVAFKYTSRVRYSDN